ncbi:MAG TPA: diacylglycerol kinase [Bauldia sp.]|nr:diacylglycerol kinase [Bauldia sp.]
MTKRPFRDRVGFAGAGIIEGWRSESTFRTLVVLGIGALAVTVALRPGLQWAALVAFAIALVLALELVNSALEAVIDHLHPGEAKPIRRAKDMAAGAVLAASTGAAVVGVLMVTSVALEW